MTDIKDEMTHCLIEMKIERTKDDKRAKLQKPAANWDKAEVENNDDTELDEEVKHASNQKVNMDWSINKPSQGPVQLNLGQPWNRQTIAEVSLVDGNIGDYG